MKVENFVYDTFLRLTSTTCPFGFEDDFMLSMRHLFPDGLQKDQWGNYFHQIGQSRTIFASHIDTVSKEFIPVNHVIEGNIIKTDGKTTLGADDKAGVTVMLWMIQNNVPGLYYFFIGEEVGCIGSGLAAQYGDFKGKYDRIISFDRRDTGSIITFQSSSRCCSETFADALCTELNKSRMNYRSDDGGVYTDSAEFMGLIP
jgi:putative aminopeptidase FrvX